MTMLEMGRHTMVQNRKKHSKNSRLIILFPTSSGVSERAKEWTDKQVVHYLRRDCWLFWTIMRERKLPGLNGRRKRAGLDVIKVDGAESEDCFSPIPCTMVWNKQESRCKYWVTHSSVRSFARTAHSFARTAHSFARTAHSFARSLTLLTSSLVGK